MQPIIVSPDEKDLGGFTVKRALPATGCKAVGPFVFFDHFGPAEFPPGEGVNVRPHPHIGIATISYLFDGEIIHRDSLGVVQPIQQGAVNLMTAGKGIVHSEKSGDDLQRKATLHGIQSWIALPDSEEDCEPDFQHYPSAQIPRIDHQGSEIRLIIGSAFGQHSPVHQYSPTRYLDCHIPAGHSLDFPNDHPQSAIYLVDGDAEISCSTESAGFPQGSMIIVTEPSSLSVIASTACHCMFISGEPVGHRHLWWNFVASSRQKIKQAKDDWRNGGFTAVPGDTEFIPLPV